LSSFSDSPWAVLKTQFAMAPSLQDVAGLKDLVNQLQDRINKIERSMKGGSEETSAERIRMILMGPPGAGM